MGLALDRAITFYQIATKIESVYVLTLPPEVSALLQVFHVAFAIDVDSFGLPLGCLSLSSFYNKLILMMLVPVVLCLLIVLGCVIGTGLIARFLQWLARVLRELSRLGSKRMPPVDMEEEEEASRPSVMPATRCKRAAPYVLEALTMYPMLQPYLIHAAALSHPGPFSDGRAQGGRRRA